MCGTGGMVGSMMLWGLVGVALLVFVVTATVWLVRRSDPSQDARGQESPVLEDEVTRDPERTRRSGLSPEEEADLLNHLR